MCYLIVVLTRPGVLQAELDYTYGNYIMCIRIHITLFCCQGIFVQCVYMCVCMLYYVHNRLFCIVVDGGWSLWKRGPCSKTCGGGLILNYTRVCDNPKPSCGGENCKGPRSYAPLTKQECNNFCCPSKTKSIILMLVHA